MTNDDSEKEAKDNKKSDSNEENKVGESFKTEPIGEGGKWFWEDGDEQKDNR